MTLRRLSLLCCALIVLLVGMVCRVYYIGTDTAFAANADAQTQVEIELPAVRGNFFDCKGRKLTGANENWQALCVPGDDSYTKLFPYVPYEQQEVLYAKRNTTTPFLISVRQNLSNLGVACYHSETRYLSLPIAVQLLGYLDGSGHGVSGLEKAYDDVLAKSADKRMVCCSTTARGALMNGMMPQILTATGTHEGVRLTLDAVLQRQCEGIAEQTMGQGCILVMECDTGNILADVSLPFFVPDCVERSIQAKDTSLIDRSLAEFNAGSVFKVVLAAAAYENGLDWFTWNCEGNTEIKGQIYRCALGRVHGECNLRTALEESCNCYFAQLGQALGGKALLRTAQEFGFGTACAVAPGLKSKSGNLPDESTLQNDAQLAMLSFGQGELLVTPLQITAMMNAIADGGIYRTPRFILGIQQEDGAILRAEENRAGEERSRAVCEKSTALVLQSMLRSVVADGIGSEAQPLCSTAGGKTGTAQTGRFDENGNELLNYWFSGFVSPSSKMQGDTQQQAKPQYVITVLQDGITDPKTSSAEIFAQVADAIDAWKSS